MDRTRRAASKREGADTARLPRRGFLAVGMGVGSAMAAGCAGLANEAGLGGNGDDGTEGGPSTGRFRLLISDRPAAIEDFSELTVTFEKARVFRASDDDTDVGPPDSGNESAPENASVTNGDSDDSTEDGQTNATEGGDTDVEDDDDPEEGDETDDDEAQDVEEPPEAEDDADRSEPEEEADESEEDDDDEGDGYVEIDLEGERADLTELVGDRATQVADLPLETGTYASIHLYVDAVEGIASDSYDPDAHPGQGSGKAGGPPGSDGEDTETAEDGGTDDPVVLDVKIPSEKLKIVRPFEIEPDGEVTFVFDINVIRLGHGGYILKPVIGESGIAGQDIEVEEVEREDADDASDGEEGTESPPGNESDDANASVA